LTTDRFIRQADFVPRESITERNVTVIGVGAIGRQVAVMLASIGVTKLRVIDHDTVEETNVVTQGYNQGDIGTPKVEVVKDEVLGIYPECEVEAEACRFLVGRHVREGETYFVCVDSITVRQEIWNAVKNSYGLVVDGRMLGETMQVLAVSNGGPERELLTYDNSFFDESEAATGRCTGQATVYTAAIAAGLMVHQFTRWLREALLEPHMMLDLPSADYMAVETTTPQPEEATAEG